MVMNKLLAIVFLIYLVGDPTLSMLEAFSDTKEFIVAALLAFIMVPWVVSQLEN
jgi:hypothetical protein